MPTPTGQIIVSGTATPQNPATYQVTAAGRPTQTQVGLIPSSSPYAFYQQVPVNALAQGGIAGNLLTFGGLTLGPDSSGWSLVSGQGGPGYVSGTWQYGSDAHGNAPAQGAFYRSGTGGAGGSGGGGEAEIEYGSEVYSNTQSQPGLGKAGWIILGLIATLILTDRGR